MKKILIVSINLLIAIIAFQACNSNSQDTPLVMNNAMPASGCANRFCKDYTFAGLQGMLDANIIQELSLSYAADNGKRFINGDVNSRDALSVVFDIEKIKTLIWQMQEQACMDGCDSTIELGIRYYFIKYPSNLGPDRTDGLNGLTAENSNKHSLVMVPVYKNKIDHEWYDYNLWNGSGQNCFDSIRLGQTIKEIMAKGFLPNAGDNHGGIGPPPEPGTFPTNDQ